MRALGSRLRVLRALVSGGDIARLVERFDVLGWCRSALIRRIADQVNGDLTERGTLDARGSLSVPSQQRREGWEGRKHRVHDQGGN